ncbi:hypothetical protein RJ45_06935 [Photobacterium gaetbulicola]|uniref:Uncharacterized protein n=1 Tax=Photobacterium gaetbulicola TaxID=1295392 RepID=A0A0B9G6M3_9GAMM|nr:hypothetical protein [Photobacterium gaetbulicola]KHT64358.1 hypothetical protein RJ45_06935 [Photobacterium gaetbulicola]
MDTENLAANDDELNTNQGLESHNEQDEKDFINSLDDDFDPTAADTQVQQQELEQQAAGAMVFVGLMTIEQTMKTIVHPRFEFDPKQAESVAEKIAPLIVKYGGNPPPWLAKYMDEIMAVAAIGMLSLSSYMQVRTLKAEDIELAKAKQKAANDDQQQEAA